MNNDHEKYGMQSNQVHPFFRIKREWSKVKDKIVGDYITCCLKTIQLRGRPIIIIDAFSGPGRFGDGLDGSPLIICKAIQGAPKRGVGIACLFSDSHPAHRVALEGCLASYIAKGIAGPPLSDFSQALSRALQVGKESTLFFYLDPYGIRDLAFEAVKQIYQRDTNQSTEVLINFSFPTFMRMSGNWSYGDTAAEVARKVKESKIDTVNRVMDGDYWLPIVTDPKLNKIEREDAVIAKYLERVRQFFPYTYSMPVKELGDSVGLVPTDDLAKYHLIFGTRSPRAVVYMNDVALNASEPYLQQFKDGLLFDMTPDRFKPCAVHDIKTAIVAALNQRPMTRPQIYESVIPKYFMQRRRKEYRAIIDEMTFKEKRLYPNLRTMKRNNQLNDNTLLAATHWPGGQGA